MKKYILVALTLGWASTSFGASAPNRDGPVEDTLGLGAFNLGVLRGFLPENVDDDSMSADGIDPIQKKIDNAPELFDKPKEMFQFAVGSLIEESERGNANAQFALAEIYFKGKYQLLQSYSEATKWYLRAAEQDHREAIYKLACVYSHGTHSGWDGVVVPRNMDAAVNLCRRAAALGHERAIDLVAILDGKNDEGVPEYPGGDCEAGVSWEKVD